MNHPRKKTFFMTTTGYIDISTCLGRICHSSSCCTSCHTATTSQKFTLQIFLLRSFLLFKCRTPFLLPWDQSKPCFLKARIINPSMFFSRADGLVAFLLESYSQNATILRIWCNNIWSMCMVFSSFTIVSSKPVMFLMLWAVKHIIVHGVNENKFSQ